MADEDAPPLDTVSLPYAPPSQGGAYDDIDFVEEAAGEDSEARGAYLSECVEEKGSEKAAPVEVEPETAAPSLAAESASGGEPSAMADITAALAPVADSIGPHLDELRKRLIISAAAFVPAFALGMWIYQWLWDALLLPLANAAPHLMRFQALTPSDGLILAMRMAFVFALFLTLPVWLAQIWSFVSPGLDSVEKRWLYLALGSGGALFFLGAAAAYFLGVPFALDYLLSLNRSLAGWENSFTGDGYVDFVMTCCIGFGLAFELPLVMLALGWAGLLTPEGLRAWWRPIILVIFVLAAVMTPPDPFSQLLLAIPMLGLFFAGWGLVKWVNKKTR